MPIDEKQGKILLTDTLMALVMEGDEQAFAELYQQSHYPVYCLLLAIVKNPATAEDLMQDTYLSVKKSIQNYVPQGKPLAWIFTIARNLAYMELRREQRRGTEDFSEHEDVESSDDISGVIDNIVLRNAMRILDEKERKIVLLHVVTGLKFTEISKAAEIPLGTVLSCYHRAIRKLHKSVNEEAQDA